MRKNRKQGQDYEHVASQSQCENFERADHLIKLMAGSKTKKYHQTFPNLFLHYTVHWSTPYHAQGRSY